MKWREYELSSLRDAVAQASTVIQKRITASAVVRLKERSEATMVALQQAYSQFFEVLADELINSGVSGEDSGLPWLISSMASRPWTELSENWLHQKSKFDSPSASDFYRGVTERIAQRQTQKHKRGRFRKSSRKVSFYQYVSKLGKDPRNTEKFFGPGSISYELRRPDGTTIKLVQSSSISGAIGGLAERPGKKFLEGLDGTLLTAQIKVFPKLTGLNMGDGAEDSITRFLGQQDGANKDQWVKIYGTRRGSHWKIRPMVTPLIQWYLNVKFEEILRGLYK